MLGALAGGAEDGSEGRPGVAGVSGRADGLVEGKFCLAVGVACGDDVE